MRTKYKIYKTIALADFFNDLRLLHHTAAQSDNHMWIFFLDPVQITQSAIYLQIRIFPHCTRIVQHKIRLLLFCQLITDQL